MTATAIAMPTTVAREPTAPQRRGYAARMLELRATAPDAPLAAALLAEYMAGRARSRPAEDGEYRSTRPAPGQFRPPHGRFLLAVEGGEPLGCAGVRRVVPGPEWRDDGFGGDRWFELKHLYTRPEARGRGVAQRLIDALADFAAEYGGDRLVLDTHDSLEAAARLYARNGFSPIPRFNGNTNANRWYGRRLDRRAPASEAPAG